MGPGHAGHVEDTQSHPGGAGDRRRCRRAGCADPWKPPACFTRDRSQADGLSIYCRDCKRAMGAAYRRSEQGSKHIKEYYRKNRERFAQWERDGRARNAESRKRYFATPRGKIVVALRSSRARLRRATTEARRLRLQELIAQQEREIARIDAMRRSQQGLG